MPVAQAAGMLTRYTDYRERVFDRQGQLQYQLTTHEYLQRMPSGRPSLSSLFALREMQRASLQLKQGTLMVNDVIVRFEHGHYQDGMLVMGNTEVTLPEGRMLAASLRFDPVQQVLDAPRAGLRHPSASRTGAPTVQDDLTVSLIPSASLRGIA
jgi:hypothetical protein